MTFDLKSGVPGSEVTDYGASIASIRNAINGPETTPEERDALLGEAEAMGKELTKAAFESSVV